MEEYYFVNIEDLFNFVSSWFQGTSVCKALAANGLILLLYSSRAIYNMIAVLPVNRETHKLPSFGYGWINVTDQVSY